jgi:hypothetical protein
MHGHMNIKFFCNSLAVVIFRYIFGLLFCAYFNNIYKSVFFIIYVKIFCTIDILCYVCRFN